MKLFFLPVCLIAILLPSCVTTNISTKVEESFDSSEMLDSFDTSVKDAVSAPFVRDDKSRALALFSQAKLSEHNEDFTTALSTLRSALEHDPASPVIYNSIGEIKIKIGQVQESLEFFNKAISLDHNNRDAHFMDGSALAALNRDNEAVVYLRKAVELDPSKENSYLQLSVVLSRMNEYEETVNVLKSLVKLNGDSILGYYYLGKIYSQMKLYRDAINYFKKALEIRPEFDQAAIDMAVCYEAKFDYSSAIDTYKNVFKQDSNNSNVLQRLIQLLIQQRRFEEALEYLKIAIGSGFSGKEVMRKTGLIYVELEQYEDAIEIFSSMLERDPHSDQIRFYLAEAYAEKGDLELAYNEFDKIPESADMYIKSVVKKSFVLKEQGNYEEAVKLLKESIAKKEDQLELYLGLSSLYESVNKNDEALSTLLAIEKSFSGEASLQFRIGVLYEKTGKRAESIKRMKAVLAITPQDPQTLNFLGYTYAEAGTNLNEALEYLKLAVSLRPNDGFFLDSLGWIYFKMKKNDEALKNLKEANQLLPEDPTITEHLGDAYYAKRDYKKALKHYKKALELDPDRKALTEKLRKLKGEPDFK